MKVSVAIRPYKQMKGVMAVKVTVGAKSVEILALGNTKQAIDTAKSLIQKMK